MKHWHLLSGTAGILIAAGATTAPCRASLIGWATTTGRSRRTDSELSCWARMATIVWMVRHVTIVSPSRRARASELAATSCMVVERQLATHLVLACSALSTNAWLRRWEARDARLWSR